MKSALEFHFEGEDPVPEPKGLPWHVENSDIERGILERGDIITSAEIF